MAVRGYTDLTAVAEELGRTSALTAAEQVVANKWIEAAENAIDNYLGRAWLGASVTDELHHLGAPWAIPADSDVSGGWGIAHPLYLQRTPVSSVSSVTVRGTAVGATETTLETSAWELLDATRGVLLIQGYGGYLAKVTYSFSAPVPLDVNRATAQIVAHAMSGGYLHPERNGVERISVGNGDLSLTFAKADNVQAWPATALALLRPYKRPVLA